MGRKGEAKVRAFVDHGREAGVRVLVSALGVQPGVARDLMTTIMTDICAVWGRQTMYIPALLDLGRTQRDDAIWADYQRTGPTGARPFTQERAEEIAAERELSLRHVYAIVQLMRKRESAHRQPTLPGFDDAP